MLNLLTGGRERWSSGAVVSSGPLRQNRSLTRALREHQHELSSIMLRNVLHWEKYAREVPKDPGDLAEYVRHEFYTFIDLLALHLGTGEASFRDIYVGQKLLQLYWPHFASPEERDEMARRALEADEREVCGFLRGKVDDEDLGRLGAMFRDVHGVLLARGGRTLDVLMVGDCLFPDVFSFLTGPCLEDGISLNPTYATSKNPFELRDGLRAMADRKFDLVFSSPFSFGFSPEYNATSMVRNSLAGASTLRAMADAVSDQAEATLGLLSSLFECPIFVHNSANVRRHDGTARERAKNLATRRTRRAARGLVNARLEGYVARRNPETFRHLQIVDERALLDGRREDELGRYIYHTDNHHATVMGEHLATLYRDLIAAHVHLRTRKLVVCDLDNTIWEGEIGEGKVRHFADRQRTLKALRGKGVVLSVNSKNDPRNVSWEGATLGEDDFVAMQINWDSKVANMKRIRDDLNLKYKDYVFIDDRADQREMVAEAFPEIHVMDATSDRTWRLLRVWSEMLEDQAETDRTQLYRERDRRESFMAATETVENDPAALFGKLELRASIREARPSDLKRVAELINRTNQFNLCGTRTSFREVSAWREAPGTHILVVEGADKFGQMGQICVAVLEIGADQARIPAFVLSCRVFGYGMETAVINAIKRKAGGLPIVGLYRETASNEPCRRMYPDNGFVWDGQAWTYEGSDVPADPSWLAVEDEWSPALAARR